MEMKHLREFLSIIDDAAIIAEQHDPNLKRSRRFRAGLEDISSAYRELYDQKVVMPNSQALKFDRNGR
ncbi:hypothetical protein M514_09438 [Trichuris suis]|uniref:Uncharacterized protein n=1 Tax=Trichuris suis TaxID=68888 RepID=A0A085MTD5_9BILA|nr:hypothetical protein M513_09438 [Trichuris suis]KFD60481.1 hypothetical protein M514_09438 [Trichuris suis]